MPHRCCMTPRLRWYWSRPLLDDGGAANTRRVQSAKVQGTRSPK